MKKRNYIFLVVLVVLAGVGYLFRSNDSTTGDKPPVTTASPVTSFEWRFSPATTNNPDGLPQTEVYVSLTREDGTTSEQSVDTTDGTCFDAEDSKYDTDKVAGTKVIQCYAAGFGYYYKIVQGDAGYKVMRKEFEEGSPEVTPVEQPYVMVKELGK